MAPLASSATNGTGGGSLRGWWLPAALMGAAGGVFAIGCVAWLWVRKPPPVDKPRLAGVAVLSLGSSALPSDQDAARAFEWCLPGALEARHVPVLPAAKLMTLQAQTNGALDRASARSLGLAVGARWVVWGTVSDKRAEVSVSTVLDDRVVHAETLTLDEKQQACDRFADGLKAALAKEPARPPR